MAATTMMEPAPSGGAARGGTGRRGAGTSSRLRTIPTGTPFTWNRSRRPWLACTSTPTVKPPRSGGSTREAVPTPPLKAWLIMPVPPPTLPSGTGPAVAAPTASATCSALTWKPLMSLRTPSQVSPTTGRPQRTSSPSRAATS